MEIKTTDNEQLRFDKFQFTSLMITRDLATATKTSVYFEGHRFAVDNSGSKVFEAKKQTGRIDDLENYVEQKLIESGSFPNQQAAKQERKRLRRAIESSTIADVDAYISIIGGLIANELNVVSLDGIYDN